MTKSLTYLFNGRFPTQKAHGVQIANMCKAFASAGLQVTLVAPYRRNDIKEDAFAYYGIKKNFNIQNVFALDVGNHTIRTLTSLIFFAWYLLWHRGDIYYARDVPTLALLCFLGLRPVAELHDYRSQKPKKLMQFILNNARAIIVNSPGTLSLLTTHYSLRTTSLIAPNAVDPTFFDISETREQAREILRLPQDKIIIGYVGRLEVAGKDKGVSVLQEAFACMRFREKAELLLVTSVSYKQVPLYLRAIDIAVIPYPGTEHAKTTSPIKHFEYMAAGKAIVVADSPDPQHLAEMLDALVADPERIKILGLQAREEAKQHTWDQRAQTILKYLGS